MTESSAVVVVSPRARKVVEDELEGLVVEALQGAKRRVMVPLRVLHEGVSRGLLKPAVELDYVFGCGRGPAVADIFEPVASIWDGPPNRYGPTERRVPNPKYVKPYDPVQHFSFRNMLFFADRDQA